MNKKLKIILSLVFVAAVVAAAIGYLRGKNIAVLEPQGAVGEHERKLLIFTVFLSLAVVVPVFTMAIVIARKYHERNTKATYAPDLDRNKFAEFMWWAIPIVIITILSVVTWTSSHALDPWKPLASDKKPLTIQVVSLDWKWLFIYPEQKVASINMVKFPSGTPVKFELTSDSVMNSFWIPQLGSQMYSMPGMSTELNLTADTIGSYRGSSANISGKGFAGMHFMADATSQRDFDAWVEATHKAQPLNDESYAKLARPSENNSPTTYTLADPALYDTIVMKYMAHGSHEAHGDHGHDMAGMD